MLAFGRFGSGEIIKFSKIKATLLRRLFCLLFGMLRSGLVKRKNLQEFLSKISIDLG